MVCLSMVKQVWDLIGFIVNLLIMAHLETLARSWFMFFSTGKNMGD